jgi:flagellar biosynthesis/type III secretory pathway chaperone
MAKRLQKKSLLRDLHPDRSEALSTSRAPSRVTDYLHNAKLAQQKDKVSVARLTHRLQQFSKTWQLPEKFFSKQQWNDL